MSKFVFLSLILTALSSKAFVNVESVRQTPGQGFFGKTDFQWNGQEGNTQKLTTWISTLNMYRLTRDEILLLGNYKYGSTAFIKDTDNGSLHARYVFEAMEPFAYEVFVQSEFDRFKDLNSRNLAGANVRQCLVATQTQKIFAGYGMFYELQDFSSVGRSSGYRANIYLSYTNRFSPAMTGAVIAYFQPSMKTFRDRRVKMQSSLDIRLGPRLSADIDFDLSHDTNLPNGVHDTDIDYLTGFSVSY